MWSYESRHFSRHNGNVIALNAVLEEVRKEGITQFIILGDIKMVGPAPSEVFATVRILNPICWIKGNTDMWVEEMSKGWKPVTEKEKELYEYYLFAKERITEEEINFLSALKVQNVVRIKNENILCVHGSPRSVLEIMDHRVPQHELEEITKGVNEKIILCGHSHIPFIGNINGRHIFNVGSVGRSLDGDTAASYGIMDVSKDNFPEFSIRRVKYSLEQTVKMGRERNFPYLDKYQYTIFNARLANHNGQITRCSRKGRQSQKFRDGADHTPRA